MPVVNFSVPQTLDRRVHQAVKLKGFPSRAELFRYAVIRYLDDIIDRPIGERSLDENPRIKALSDDIENIVLRKYSRKSAA